MNRHRGAKPERRCELLTPISLLSPAYLLSVERWPLQTAHLLISDVVFVAFASLSLKASSISDRS